MKTRILYLFLFIASYSFSQSVNNYKAVLVPLKFDFMKSENQYRLATITKFNLNKAGFEAFYNNQEIPKEFNDRCSLLVIDVVNNSSFLKTKLFITLKDCNGKIIFQSEMGFSKEKDYEKAYSQALNDAFKSVYALGYKHETNSQMAVKTEVIVPEVATKPLQIAVVEATKNNEYLLYAQPTATGFQLIDSTPKVIMKIFKTSNPSSFVAIKGTVQGVLVAKNNQWFFEYYQNDKLISEIIPVKF